MIAWCGTFLEIKSPMTQTSLVKGIVVKLAEDKRIELSAFRLARFSRPITSIGAIFQIFWRKGWGLNSHNISVAGLAILCGYQFRQPSIFIWRKISDLNGWPLSLRVLVFKTSTISLTLPIFLYLEHLENTDFSFYWVEASRFTINL